MLGSKIIVALRRRKFRTGAVLVRFVAKDVKREIRVIDDSGLPNGFVIAQVRTSNVLHLAKGLEPEQQFEDPEILRVDRAWDWGGESWGGKAPERPRIPLITAEQLSRAIRDRIPEATIRIAPVNTDYDSWRIEAELGTRAVEFVWGPLSGFGGIDPASDSPNPFAHCDEYLFSIDAALEFAVRRLETNNGEQSVPPQSAAHPDSQSEGGDNPQPEAKGRAQ